MSNQWPSERPSTMRHARRQQPKSALPLVTFIVVLGMLLVVFAATYLAVETYVAPALDGLHRVFANS